VSRPLAIFSIITYTYIIEGLSSIQTARVESSVRRRKRKGVEEHEERERKSFFLFCVLMYNGITMEKISIRGKMSR